jgi:hypothetical protein
LIGPKIIIIKFVHQWSYPKAEKKTLRRLWCFYFVVLTLFFLLLYL